jgi:hypothetical protein
MDIVIVGAGLAGLTAALTMSSNSLPFIVIEKTNSVGGQWRHNANFLSRVNSSEPSYRLPMVSREQHNTNHTHHYQVLEDILRAVQQHGLASRLHTLTEVRSNHRLADGRWLLAGCQQTASRTFEVNCQVSVLCTNRRLGNPRQLFYPGERDRFRGQVARGLAGDSDFLRCNSERVVVLGMGAFAIEVMRTTLERAASHVTILCRQRGACTPHVLDWLRFIRPFDPKTVRTDSVGDALVFGRWQGLYTKSSAVKPECWREGIVKPDGHTVSVSDIFFVAHGLRRLITQFGEAKSLTEDAVITNNDDFLPADILLKCIGFEINEGNEKLLGRSHTRLHVGGCHFIYEPHLDSAVFTNLFVTSGHMNVAAFFSERIVASLRKPNLFATPMHRINLITVSEAAETLSLQAQDDKDMQQSMRTSVSKLIDTFHDTMSPEAYLANNETLWHGLHQMLRRSQTDPEAPKELPYQFSTILSELAEFGAGVGAQREASAKGSLHSLLDVEYSLLGLTNPSIDCLTFYEGEPPVALLQERLDAMVQANLWVAGRLRANSSGEIVQLWVPDLADAELTVEEASVAVLLADMHPADAARACAPFRAKIGLECVDADEPLFRVCVLRGGNGIFALLVSLSHAIGDAATFYKLFAMLDSSEPGPTSLDFTRVTAFNVVALKKAFGTEVVGGHTRLPSTKKKDLQQMLKMHEANSARREAKDVTLHLIDEGWISMQKHAHEARAQVAGFGFLSTNDVLASWFLSEFGATVGNIVCDCRGRLPGMPGPQDFKPGSYISSVMCIAEEFSSPVHVRRKVTETLRRAAEPSPPAVPPIQDSAKAPRVGNVTNWSTVYHHLELSGCKHLVHFPVVDSERDMFHANIYIFCPREGAMAALVFKQHGDGATTDGAFKEWAM